MTKVLAFKPDYIRQLEHKLLGWFVGIMTTLIIGFVGLTVTSIINLNRLEVRFDEHQKNNQTMFQEVQNRLSNHEQIIYKPLTGTQYNSSKNKPLN